MRILYLHQHFTIPSGRSGIRSYEFARYLAGKGHDVTVISGNYDLSGIKGIDERKIYNYFNFEGVNVIIITNSYSQHMSMPLRLWSFVRFMFLATLVALRVRFDIVFATSTPLTIAVPGMVASWVKRKPFVFEVRDVWPDVPIALGVLKNPIAVRLALALELLAYKTARHIIAFSPGMREYIVRKNIPSEKVSIISNVSMLHMFQATEEQVIRKREELGSICEEPLVIYIGAFGKANGVHYLPRLAHEIDKQDKKVNFLLIGGGTEKQRVIAEARQLGVLNKRVWVFDSIDKDKVAPFLKVATAASSVFSPIKVLYTNSANKFFDGLAAGKPLIINYPGWQKELLEQSGAGISLDPFDFGVAADKLIEHLHDGDWVQRAEKASRRLAEDHFDSRMLAGYFEDILLRVHQDEPVQGAWHGMETETTEHQ